MLTIYRRHKRNCEHQGEGRKYRRCRCPIWVDGFVGGKEVRKSIDITDWGKAQDKVRQWESQESEPTPVLEPITIQVASERFLMNAATQKLNESTIYKYRLLFKQIGDFSQKRGLRYVKELDLVTLDDFRAGWKDGARSSAKKLERLRAFFRFAQEREWITKNPAAGLRAPKVTLCPTMPYTGEEMLRILAAIDKYRDAFPARGRENALRLRGLVLLLRYSGMRIGDAVSLSADRIEGDRLFLYTQKTGVAVNTVLPNFVVKTLEAIPKVKDRHFFWNGMGKLETIVGSWRRRLAKLFELAGVSKGHAHRFRDTFAVELLLSGVLIERVSVLLGHQSVRITEKHYSPWVRARQEQLEADLRRSWELDPVSLMEAKGTPGVHEKNERIN
ncbi:MAG TPA: tyrosine-type recombinase/integrase [Candidatus Acidoferrum sp.]|nr:tyrosine-type recombinase/integrase [Candidatus Acidoferrum sp.]